MYAPQLQLMVGVATCTQHNNSLMVGGLHVSTTTLTIHTPFRATFMLYAVNHTHNNDILSFHPISVVCVLPWQRIGMARLHWT